MASLFSDINIGKSSIFSSNPVNTKNVPNTMNYEDLFSDSAPTQNSIFTSPLPKDKETSSTKEVALKPKLNIADLFSPDPIKPRNSLFS